MTGFVRRSVEKPLARRSWWDRFIVAVTLGDSGRNMAQVEGCWHLHETADMERNLYGDVISPSVRDHVDGTPAEREAYERATSGHPAPLLGMGPGCRLHWMQVEYH